MTLNAHTQERRTGTATITRISKPRSETLLKEKCIQYIAILGLQGLATNFCSSADTVTPNDNISTSELPQTQESNSGITHKLISTTHDTVSDVKATQKMAQYGHNSSPHCSSATVTVQLTGDFCEITAETMKDEERTYGIKEIDSLFTAGHLQTSLSDCNIQVSCNAEINTKENKRNNIQKISKNNKENHVVNSTETVNRYEEFLHLATESAQQTATDVLEMPWERAKALSDEDRTNSIQEVDSGCSSGDVQALRINENKIQMSWNAHTSSGGNKSNSIQKVSITTKGNDAGYSKEMVNSGEKLSDALTRPSQHSGRDVLGTPYKTGQSCFYNSRENNCITSEVISPTDGLQCLAFAVTMLGSETICPPENMSSTISASNKSTGSLTEAATPTVCTSRATARCNSIKTSTPAPKNSSEEQEETKSTARKINYANTGTKKISKIYSLVVPKSSSMGPISALLSLTPQDVYNNIMEKHYPRAVKRHLFSSHKNTCVQSHSQKYTPTILLQPNQNQRSSNAKICTKQSPIKKVETPIKIRKELYPKITVVPRNLGASINIPSAEAVLGNGSKSATITKLSDTYITKTMLEMPQPPSVNIVSTCDTVRRPMISAVHSSPTLLTASRGISTANFTMTTSASNLCVPANISSPSTFSRGSKGPLTSATSDATNPSKTLSVAQEHMTKSQLPTAPKSNSINLCACYSYVNTTDTGHDTLKQDTKLTKELEYQPTPNYVFSSNPTKTIHLEKGTQSTSNCCQPTSSAKHPKLPFSETLPSQTVQKTHQQKDIDTREINTSNSIQDDAAEYAERNLVKIHGRDRGRTPAGANFGNRQSTKRRYEMHRYLYSETYLSDARGHDSGKRRRGRGSRLRGSMLCRSNIRNSSITEQTEGAKRKYAKPKIMRNDQKNYGKIKKRAYIRKTACVSNNKKKITTPPPYSTDTDQSCSKESQKIVTRTAEHIPPHHDILEKADNNFSCKSCQIFASPCQPVANHMTHNYIPSDRNSLPIIMDVISSDDTSTQYSKDIASNNFQNNEQQTESQFEYSAPLITECEYNFMKVPDNIHHKYMAYQQEQMSQIQYNEKYFSSSQKLAALCTGKYENVGIQGDTFKFRSNQGFPVEEVERHIEQQIMENQHNFTELPDNIYHQYAAYGQQLTWKFQHNNQYFPSSQNIEELHTGMYKNVGTCGDIFKFNRKHGLPQENIERHTDQQNDYYETSIIQNGYQHVMNETEANSYGYQLERKTTKLNDEDFQWDACSNIYHYCGINHPPPTENSVNCQPSSKIGYGNQNQYYQAFSAEGNSEEVQKVTFISNENIHHEQLAKPKCTNLMPTIEMFQEEAWQELGFYTSHKSTDMEQIYVNNEENIAQTSNDPLTTYNDQMQIPTDSNLFPILEAEFLKPQSQSTNNFRPSKDAQLSEEYTKTTLEASTKKYARNKRGTTRQKTERVDKPFICSLCGERAQYNVLLRRHLELHHGHSTENSFSLEDILQLQ
jgi:hypothetical protein